jgi:hypothetical protein
VGGIEPFSLRGSVWRTNTAMVCTSPARLGAFIFVADAVDVCPPAVGR